jgi:hypothetical protein
MIIIIFVLKLSSDNKPITLANCLGRIGKGEKRSVARDLYPVRDEAGEGNVEYISKTLRKIEFEYLKIEFENRCS